MFILFNFRTLNFFSAIFLSLHPPRIMFSFRKTYPLSCKLFFTWLIHLSRGHFPCILRFNSLC
ncbi:hypothetical protein L9F63_013848, partial [Diploptera punctata]